ncbi:MAG: HD domain-containing protein [Bacteroidia bacterium]
MTKKIFNDPIYGFITIPFPLIMEIIDHPFFQRLRRIRQLGLTHLVYPGALHTRFHHAMGSMHLMTQAIETLRSKGTDITEEEAEAVTVAVLLHDVGHGPFSHALEHSIVDKITHENISSLIMDRLNSELGGRLQMAIQIFRGEYKKKFLHQLVSSQLDMDRLDYLNRDSFFTGVSEGVVSSDRIIKMLDVRNDELVVEEKGIYSIEKFIVARRLMYWQVYLHKTVTSAEMLLVKILQRAKELAKEGTILFATPVFHSFLYNNFGVKDFMNDEKILQNFINLDDNDVMASIKVWVDQEDKILSTLCKNLLKRKLYKIRLSKNPVDKNLIEVLQSGAASLFNINKEDSHYMVFAGEIINSAYETSSTKINILYKDETITDIAEASDHTNIAALSGEVKKYYLCYPAECRHLLKTPAEKPFAE